MSRVLAGIALIASEMTSISLRSLTRATSSWSSNNLHSLPFQSQVGHVQDQTEKVEIENQKDGLFLKANLHDSENKSVNQDPSDSIFYSENMENVFASKPVSAEEVESDVSVEEQGKEKIWMEEDEKMDINNGKTMKAQKIVEFTERKIPANSFQRAAIFGWLGVRLAVATQINRVFPAKNKNGDVGGATKPNALDAFFSPANAEILVKELCRLRGAALKLGQMLSIQDQDLFPKEFLDILERVRQSADIMPRNQLEGMLIQELGKDWHTKFKSFNLKPIAAASIGQVHEAYLLDGTKVAVKVQYPGVAESIDSDLVNLRRIIDMFNVFPKGLFLDQILKFAREELSNEVDYLKEAIHQTRYRELLRQPDSVDHEKILCKLNVPKIISELSTRRILVQEFVEGIAVDRCIDVLKYSQRQSIAYRLWFLMVKELFDWRYVQSDPNWSNFIYDPKKDILHLIDFGACRSYSENFVHDYMLLVDACANRNAEKIKEFSLKLKFLTGGESKVMLDSHIRSGFIAGEPFQVPVYEFENNTLARRLQDEALIQLNERLTSPPTEAYSIHRKLSGAFMTGIKLKAIIPLRKIFYDVTRLRESPLPKL